MDEWEGRDDWSRFENQLWEDMAEGTDFLNDPYLQALYEASFFEFGQSPGATATIRDALYVYMENEYNVNFDDIFDWEAWREAYGVE